MKTKSQFLAVALTAVCLEGLLPAGRCQIVGYQTVPIVAGYNFIANPFDATDNTLANVISPSAPPLGTTVYWWDVTNQQYAAPSVYSPTGWTANLVVPPGIGFVIGSTSSWALTFSGTLVTGTRTHYYAGANKFSLLASCFAVSDALTGPTMTFPGLDGENVFLYDNANQTFSDAFTYYVGYGWFDPDGNVAATGPVINLGHCFFAQNLGPNTNWVQTYGGPGLPLTSQSSPQASIQSIHATGGKVSLNILNPQGTTYGVQYSADGSLWTTVAAKQTGTTWTGPAPEGPRGFYRLTNP